MKRMSAFIILALLQRTLCAAADIADLSVFSQSPDKVVRGCYELASAALEKGKALCKAEGFGENWVCPPSKEIRFKALERCKANAKAAKDQPAMLYLLGLLHQDYRYKPDNTECPEYFRYQEGSGVCVYTDDHFKQLMSEHPESKYADMAAVKQAETAYRYYECEGGVLCSIENQITGWIVFLENKPTSRFADMATAEIVDSLASLSGAKIDAGRESPTNLLEDLDNLRAIAPRLSSENRTKLTASLEAASAILTEIEKAQPD
jgi:hypothetical protein